MAVRRRKEELRKLKIKKKEDRWAGSGREKQRNDIQLVEQVFKQQEALTEIKIGLPSRCQDGLVVPYNFLIILYVMELNFLIFIFLGSNKHADNNTAVSPSSFKNICELWSFFDISQALWLR